MTTRYPRRPSRAECVAAGIAEQVAAAARTMVEPVRLAEAAAAYVDWEAYAYWVRAIVESEKEPPEVIRRSLQERCPGFLEYEKQYRRRNPQEEPFLWLRLIEWINTRIFAEAAREGWLDAVLYDAARDPRSKRAGDHWLRCKETWRDDKPHRYPSFEEWRQAAGLGSPQL